MKSFQLRGETTVDNLHCVEVAAPKPGPGQVLIRMLAWSLNYRDLLVVAGHYSSKLPNPLTPISDGVGEIMDAGPGVTDLKQGQRVSPLFFPDWESGKLSGAKTRRSLGALEQGILAELVVCDARSAIAIPDFLGNEEAATLPCAGLTAWNSLFHSQDQFPGKTLLTMGSGGVSVFALQFARVAGWRVAAVSRRNESLERMKQMGLEQSFNSSENPDWGNLVRKWSEGGVDHVLELGGGATLPQSLKAVAAGGEISLVGILGGAEKEFNPISVIMKAIHLRGVFVGSRDMFQEMVKGIEVAGIKPVISRIFPFLKAKEAFREMEKGNHFGKICITL